ncbi:MAG: ETC complex I subunit [Sphingomonas fennica]
MTPEARIVQQTKNAMQSGKARTGQWTLEYGPNEAKRPDPLTGWAGSGDVQGQVRLRFETLEEARAYAEAQGLNPVVVPAPPKTLKIQAYADNFKGVDIA